MPYKSTFKGHFPIIFLKVDSITKVKHIWISVHNINQYISKYKFGWENYHQNWNLQMFGYFLYA